MRDFQGVLIRVILNWPEDLMPKSSRDALAIQLKYVFSKSVPPQKKFSTVLCSWSFHYFTPHFRLVYMENHGCLVSVVFS